MAGALGPSWDRVTPAVLCSGARRLGRLGTLSLHSPVFQATELRLKSQWLRSPAWVLLGMVLPAPPVLPQSKVPLENHRLQALSMTSFLENRINSSFPARTCAPPSPKSSLHLSDPELMTLSI